MPGNHLNPKTNPRKACSRVSRSLSLRSRFIFHTKRINFSISGFEYVRFLTYSNRNLPSTFRPLPRPPRRAPNKGRNVGKQFVRETNNENKNDVYQGAVRKWRHESQLGSVPAVTQRNLRFQSSISLAKKDLTWIGIRSLLRLFRKTGWKQQQQQGSRKAGSRDSRLWFLNSHLDARGLCFFKQLPEVCQNRVSKPPPPPGLSRVNPLAECVINSFATN